MCVVSVCGEHVSSFRAHSWFVNQNTPTQEDYIENAVIARVKEIAPTVVLPEKAVTNLAKLKEELSTATRAPGLDTKAVRELNTSIEAFIFAIETFYKKLPV